MRGKIIAVVRHPAALEEDCRIADIVIAPFSVGKGCETAARVVIDRRALQAEGAHAIYIEGLSIRSESVAATRGRRPWVPDRQIAKPVLPSGQAYARDQGASDEAPDPRLDGNPEERCSLSNHMLQDAHLRCAPQHEEPHPEDGRRPVSKGEPI